MTELWCINTDSLILEYNLKWYTISLTKFLRWFHFCPNWQLLSLIFVFQVFSLEFTHSLTSKNWLPHLQIGILAIGKNRHKTTERRILLTKFPNHMVPEHQEWIRGLHLFFNLIFHSIFNGPLLYGRQSSWSRRYHEEQKSCLFCPGI